MTECSLRAELKDAQDIIEAFREDNVRLENELEAIKNRLYDACDLCDVLFHVDNRSVKILAGMIKKCLQEKRNVPQSAATDVRGTTSKNQF